MVMPSMPTSNWPLAHRLDHRVPARQLPLDLDVEALGDLVEGVVLPADPLPGLRVGEIERRVGVLGDGDDRAAAEIGQARRRRRRLMRRGSRATSGGEEI